MAAATVGRGSHLLLTPLILDERASGRQVRQTFEEIRDHGETAIPHARDGCEPTLCRLTATAPATTGALLVHAATT
jgi:hypothetical protein